jgi:hypothetical protein
MHLVYIIDQIHYSINLKNCFLSYNNDNKGTVVFQNTRGKHSFCIYQEVNCEREISLTIKCCFSKYMWKTFIVHLSRSEFEMRDIFLQVLCLCGTSKKLSHTINNLISYLILCIFKELINSLYLKFLVH